MGEKFKPSLVDFLEEDKKELVLSGRDVTVGARTGICLATQWFVNSGKFNRALEYWRALNSNPSTIPIHFLEQPITAYIYEDPSGIVRIGFGDGHHRVAIASVLQIPNIPIRLLHSRPRQTFSLSPIIQEVASLLKQVEDY